MRLWKYVEMHHDDLGCLWFLVPLVVLIPLLVVAVDSLLPAGG
jgi:hypothetical protein